MPLDSEIQEPLDGQKKKFLDGQVKKLLEASESEIMDRGGAAHLAEIEALQRLQDLRKSAEASQKQPRKFIRQLIDHLDHWMVLGTAAFAALAAGVTVVSSMFMHRQQPVAWLDVVTARAEFLQSPAGGGLKLFPELEAQSIEISNDSGLRVQGDSADDPSLGLTGLKLESIGNLKDGEAFDAIRLKSIEAPAGARWTIDASLHPDLGLTIYSEEPIELEFHVPDDAQILATTKSGAEPSFSTGLLSVATKGGTSLEIQVTRNGLANHGEDVEFHGAIEAQLVNFKFTQPARGSNGKVREVSAIQSGTLTFNAFDGFCPSRELRYRETIRTGPLNGELLRLRLVEDGIAIAWTGETSEFLVGSSSGPKEASPTRFQYYVGENPRGYVTSLIVSGILAVVIAIIMVVVRRLGGEAITAAIEEYTE